MNSLKEIFEEVMGENLEETPDYIIVQLYNTDLLKHLTEGQWKPAGIKDYWVRKDAKHTPDGQLHAHVAHKKHINTKTQQVAWNVDGTKKDKITFNNNFESMSTAKDIARKALDLPVDFQLENINYQTGKLLAESVGFADLNLVYIFEEKVVGEKTGV